MTGLIARSGCGALTEHERGCFERDGYVILSGALDAEETERGRRSIARAYDAARSLHRLSATGSLHQLSAVTRCPELAFLLDHPRTFRWVWSLLGWNVHVYHSHVDVHPRLSEQQPPWWHWHQDGGRQNREIESDPRPRMSVKIGYWFSDVSEMGRGNLIVIPGSHHTNWLPGPSRRHLEHPRPADATEVQVRPGDAIVFDRRLWHARSDNYSPFTRMAAFFGYTYRWVTIRDHIAHLPGRTWWPQLNPVQRQLLGYCGDGSGDHAWGHDPQTTPLYVRLAEHGLLDPEYPPLKP